ncbi:MAG: RsmE family RNA methyltransferase [candidate division WOR-3 bacterium]
MPEIHNLFYIPSAKTVSNRIFIEERECHHLKNVLRIKRGEIIFLTDGKGNQFKAEVIDIKRNGVEIKVLEKEFIPQRDDFILELGFVPLKGRRNDFIIEKGTELGIRRFLIFGTKAAVVKEIGQTKFEHLRNIAVAAMLQSLQYYLPEIMLLKDDSALLSNFAGYNSVFVADPDGVRDFLVNGKRILYIVGPEGGFEKSEVKKFTEYGACLISLGKNRLRSETAAIVGITKILSLLGKI